MTTFQRSGLLSSAALDVADYGVVGREEARSLRGERILERRGGKWR